MTLPDERLGDELLVYFMFDIDSSRIIEILTYNPDSPMIFSSGLFLFLFLGVSLIYALLQKATTARILFVTLFSYYFYYKSSGFYFVLLALVTLTDFCIGHYIHHVKMLGENSKKEHDKKYYDTMAKLFVALSLVIDLGMLGYFKYTNFFGSLFCEASSWIPDVKMVWKDLDIFLPVGVSFFTFQSLSYTIDIYRGRIKPLGNLLDYAFYVSFFPQLVAGPIVRASDFIPQIRRKLVVTNEMLGSGMFFIIAGLFKKAVISDYISVNFVERVFDLPTLYSGMENLLAVYGYTLQIYCDFSGYSDMAIGIALLLGFEFPKNFDAPYKSKSVTEFWRRWHISLSSWLKDYLYISLGGNRKGKFRQYVNLMLTMLLGGLWHGASLTFILWGGIHGLFLCLDKMWHTLVPALSPLTYLGKNAKTPNWAVRYLLFPLTGLITFHVACACWVLFRASNLKMAGEIFGQIFTSLDFNILTQWIGSYCGVATLMILGFVLHFSPKEWSDRTRKAMGYLPLPVTALILVVVIWIVIQVKSSEVQPFIYFQF